MVTITKTTTWNYITYAAIRFWLVYLFIYIFPFPIELFSTDNLFTNSYRQVWSAIVPFAGKLIFNIDVGPRGSDTLFHYTRIFTIFIIAFFLSLIWTVWDKRRNSNTIFYWLTVYVRYYLAYNMLDYGFSKIFNVQFTPLFPDLDQLVQPYGDFSPQGLLWKFMSYSKSYQLFTGLGELVGGLFILFRRTTTLGAFIIVAVMSNVVMMNISYDVPVKIYAGHLLLMAIFLIVIDAKRIVHFFILNKPVPKVKRVDRFKNERLSKLSLFLKISAVLYLLYFPWNLYAGLNKQWYSNSLPPLYGIYKVENFKMPTEPTSVVADSLRWKRMIVNFPGIWVNIQMMNDTLKTYNFFQDTIAKKLIISSPIDSLNKYFLSYHQPKKDVLKLTGKWREDSIQINLQKVDINNFRLVRWRNHWIYRERTIY